MPTTSKALYALSAEVETSPDSDQSSAPVSALTQTTFSTGPRPETRAPTSTGREKLGAASLRAHTVVAFHSLPSWTTRTPSNPDWWEPAITRSPFTRGVATWRAKAVLTGTP